MNLCFCSSNTEISLIRILVIFKKIEGWKMEIPKLDFHLLISYGGLTVKLTTDTAIKLERIDMKFIAISTDHE